MKNLIVRKARLDELATLLEFEQAIISAERPFDATLRAGEIHYYDLAQLIVSADAEVLVAEVENVLVGSGSAEIKKAENYWQHEYFAYLGFMYVRPEFRGKGVNQKILDALKLWAIERNLTELRLEVYQDNLPARKAYEKAGFKANLLEMRLDTRDG
jgi:GNAT superfamily N-acetyltransferase